MGSMLAIAALYLGSGVLVWYNDTHHKKLAHALKALLPVYPLVGVIAFSTWFYLNDFQPWLGWMHYIETHTDAIFEAVTPIGGLFVIIFTIVVGLGVPALSVVAIPIALFVLLKYCGEELPKLGYVLALPFVAVLVLVREGIFFWNKPREVVEIKRALTQEKDHRKAAHKVAETVERELGKALKEVKTVRWWKPNLSMLDSARHYRDLSKFIDSLTRLSASTDEYLEKKEEEEKRYGKK